MTDRLLTSAEAFEETTRLAGSGLLDSLKQTLSGAAAGKRCLILGSAPGPVAPPLAAFDALFCINASPWSAAQLGLQRPDVHVLVGYTTNRKTPVSVESMHRLAGLSATTLLFIEAGDNTAAARAALDEIGFACQRFISLTPIERAAIIREVCGEDLGLGPRDSRVSNGFFSALLALWAGAREVILTGMSLNGGHNYLNEQTPRHHLDGDRRCLALLAKSGKATTTSPELAALLTV